MINLHHYSRVPGLKELDPQFQGTGAKGAENKHGVPDVKVTYFYREGTPPEDLVTQGAKSKYTVQVPHEGHLYDIGKDPQKIIHGLREASKDRQVNPGSVTRDEMLGAVKQAGFHGFHNSNSPLSNAVGMFHPTKPSSEEDLTGMHMKKALVDTGKTPDQKAAQRAERNVRSATWKPSTPMSERKDRRGDTRAVEQGHSAGDRKMHVGSDDPVVGGVHRTKGDFTKPKAKAINQTVRQEAKGIKPSLTKATGGSKHTQRSEHKNLKGVHTSGGYTGLEEKGQSQAGRNIERAKEPQQNKYMNEMYHGRGKELHREKLEELRSMPKPKLTKDESDDMPGQALDKSKNVREQKKKVFGTQSSPTKPAMREKHMTHIRDFVKRRYGIDMQESGGKIDEKTGQRRDANPEVGVDKPDWRSGSLESQSNPDAMVHELGHLETLPEGTDLPEGQRMMDRQYADVQKEHGYMKQKRSQGEVQPMAMENPIRRRAGLPAARQSVPVKPGDAPRTAVDTGDVIGTRVQQGKKQVDLIRQSRNMTPENQDRQRQIDEGVLTWTEGGWAPGKTPDAKVNARQMMQEQGADPMAANKIVTGSPEQQEVPKKMAAAEGPEDQEQNEDLDQDGIPDQQDPNPLQPDQDDEQSMDDQDSDGLPDQDEDQDAEMPMDDESEEMPMDDQDPNAPPMDDQDGQPPMDDQQAMPHIDDETLRQLVMERFGVQIPDAPPVDHDRIMRLAEGFAHGSARKVLAHCEAPDEAALPDLEKEPNEEEFIEKAGEFGSVKVIADPVTPVGSVTVK